MRLFLLMTCLLLSACWWENVDQPVLYPAAFAHLPGWSQDDHAAALRAWRNSCGVLEKTRAEWQRPFRLTGGQALYITSEDLRLLCADMPEAKDAASALAFFETHFMPYLLTRDGYPAGLITGYYAPVLKGARQRSKHYAWPLYKLPPELAKTEPQNAPDRASIDAGALEGRGLELLWVDDPVMRFFLHVQGSGFVELEDGSRVQLRYAGKNGLPYVPIGRVMAERGIIPLQQVTMPAIRAWLRDHPEKQSELFAQNPSYVFFTLEENAPPVIGAQGVPLTSGRSLAVDATLYPYGLPMFLTAAVPRGEVTHGEFWQRLMIAQDTGSAIRGPVRADVYFGEGAPAEALAGHMNSPGSLVLLVPKNAVERSHGAP
jgi:membrane-bound lytic murein transglycosylase A